MEVKLAKETYPPIKIRFHFADLKIFKLAATRGRDSWNLLREILVLLQDDLKQGNGRIIDRDEKKEGVSRKLIVHGIRFEPQEKLVYGKISLLRDNLPALLNKDNYSLSPIANLNSWITEITNFYIDYSGEKPVFCVQYNDDGPRISDLEYYLRQVFKKEKLARGCRLIIHFDRPIDEVLKSLDNVYKFNLKMVTSNLHYFQKDTCSNFISKSRELCQETGAKVFRLELPFDRVKLVKEKKKNHMINKVARGLLSIISEDNSVIDKIKDFKLEAEDEKGNDLILDLVKGKSEIEDIIERNARGGLKTSDLNSKMVPKFIAYNRKGEE